MQTFIKDDAEAILRIPLSHRAVVDSIIWLPNKNGGYSVKSGYHVTKQILRQDDWAESSFFFFFFFFFFLFFFFENDWAESSSGPIGI